MTITGDQNDGDSSSNTTQINDLSDLILTEHELFEGSHQLTYAGFCRYLAEACKKTSNSNEKPWDKHNWCRFEYDDDKDYQHRTTLNFAELIGCQPPDDECDDADVWIKYDETIERITEFLDGYVTSGEIGIHTIESITVTPVGEVIVFM